MATTSNVLVDVSWEAGLWGQYRARVAGIGGTHCEAVDHAKRAGGGRPENLSWTCAVTGESVKLGREDGPFKIKRVVVVNQ